MDVIARIVLTDTQLAGTMAGMFTQTPTPTRRTSRRLASDGTFDPWMLWSVESPQERAMLSVAELAECRCPDLCDRDHANE